MNTEYNQIRDAYLRNLFADDKAKTDVLALYSELTNLDVKGDYDETLYHLAARYADAEAIRFLKEKGLRPVADKYGNTAFHALASAKFDLNHTDVHAKRIHDTTKALLDAGINPKKKNDAGKIAYVDAGLLYMYPMLDALGDAGIKMDATDSEGKNLLHVICEKMAHRKDIPGAVEAASKTVKILVEKGGIDVEDKDVFGTTPITYAQRSGVKELAAILSGEEGDTITGGMTLHEAVLNRDAEALKKIIENGADLDELSDQYRRTPLMLACEYPSKPLVDLLIEAGANVNYRTGTGETAIYILLTKAISNFGRGMSTDLKDVVKMLRKLIDHDLEVDAGITNEGDTAINVICQAGYLADLNTLLAEELIEAGCDINKPNQYGKTPLMSFAQRGNEQKYGIAELLLDNNADATYVDNAGNTALIYAAGNPDQMSAKKLVSLILDKDTSTMEKVNNAGQTAMDVAIQHGNEAVLKQMLA
ncbi:MULTISPECIES: ankyrin repeat domain-containing protein [unclassified Mucilaginibacter]|uniref:ankyrin repeat domain-containing protein n=1 Tax=unclassified Mucilaginibacter TaxID=2617802 RepID=UPI0009593223|nr:MULTISPECIES: ankyrin repeat domain-containing protein [unclassified Mucilaginibacter]OJW13288.1 MAG: hypothetical protein BGO48_00565 [Mucilaginibacter sp. 44-25]PLW88565.1 MAG: hypothetical protein C0154_15995 [Mucilaginibacter sp.]HEK20124.1 ankyrin repeat domain-containing protein [Bacteroidota bacterium]